MNSLILKNEQDTLLLAKHLSVQVKPPFIIFLEGELGAGKTTFVRSFLRSLGFLEPVKSPTFTLVENYHIQNYDLYHFDLYRLEDDEELEYIGIREYFNENSIVFIEWPERGLRFLPIPDIILKFVIIDIDNDRQCTIEARTSHGEKIKAQLLDSWKLRF